MAERHIYQSKCCCYHSLLSIHMNKKQLGIGRYQDRFQSHIMKIPQIYIIFLRLFFITTWITVFARDLLSIILYWAYYSQGVTASRPPWISKRLPTSSAAGAFNYDRWGRDLQAPSQAGHGKWHGQRVVTNHVIARLSGYANTVSMLTQG